MEENQEFKVNLGYSRPRLKNKTVKDSKHKTKLGPKEDGSGAEKNQEKLVLERGGRYGNREGSCSKGPVHIKP